MKTVDEIKTAVSALFDGADEVQVRHSTRNGRDSVEITVAAMYECPTFSGGLLAMLQGLQEATGCQEIDILEEFSHGGCETCDYGSSYGKVYVAW